MNRMLIVLVLVVAGVVAGIATLGFSRGWFSFASAGADDKTNITLTVDKDKIQEDEKKAQEKVQDWGHQGKDKAPAPTEKSKD
jgi:hypothetical protein